LRPQVRWSFPARAPRLRSSRAIALNVARTAREQRATALCNLACVCARPYHGGASLLDGVGAWQMLARPKEALLMNDPFAIPSPRPRAPNAPFRVRLPGFIGDK
jgi:hypothetical protein